MTSFRSRLAEINWKFILLTVVLCILADQLSKLAILRHFQIGDVVEVVPGFFNLTLHFNKGAAFGLFAGLEDGYRQLVLGVFSKLALLMLVYFLIYDFYNKRLPQVFIALILGGAIGNIIDRVFRGQVVDFLDVYYSDYHWPAFNIADSCICVGFVLLIIYESGLKLPTRK